MENHSKFKDQIAYAVIGLMSALVYYGVYLTRILPHPENLSFDRYLFADLNAILNITIIFFLIMGRRAAKNKDFQLHAKWMGGSLILSSLFLIGYLIHHYLAGVSTYLGSGISRYLYYLFLISHIIMAAISLPIILFTAFQGFIGNRERHKKLTRFTFPVWIFVMISGVVVYLMISPYYQR